MSFGKHEKLGWDHCHDLIIASGLRLGYISQGGVFSLVMCAAPLRRHLPRVVWRMSRTFSPQIPGLWDGNDSDSQGYILSLRQN